MCGALPTVTTAGGPVKVNSRSKLTSVAGSRKPTVAPPRVQTTSALSAAWAQLTVGDGLRLRPLLAGVALIEPGATPSRRKA